MRYYSSTAGAMTLAANAGAGDTTIQLSTVVGLPASYPYTLILDPGGAEEIVTVTAGSGTTLTVTRASDGTSAQAHSLGDPVRHGISARDLREPQEHINATADVHGVVGDLVGATEVQDLTNKTLKAASAATPGAIVKGAASQTAAILDVQDSAGASLVSVLPGEGTHTVGSTVKTNNGPTANVFKYIKRIIIGAADVVGLQVRANAAQTADLQQWQKSDGSTLAKVDKDGKLSAPDATFTGTAWTNVTINSGFAQQGSSAPQVRRIGNVVYMRWGWSNTGMTPTAAFDVGVIPTGFRPPQEHHTPISGSSAATMGSGVVKSDGTVQIKTGASVGAYYLFATSWLTD